MRARWTAGLAALVAATAALPAGAAGEGLTLTSVTPGTGTVVVKGTLALPDSAFAPVTVSTDAAGDSRVAGTDLRDTTAAVTGWPAKPTLVLTTGLAAGGTPPLHGFSLPVDVGDGRNLWLGAGTPGSNSGRTANWTGVCVITTGYSCATDVPGSISATGVRWELPYGGSAVPVKGGTTVAAGSAYGSVPTSFAWPGGVVTAGVSPHDSGTPLGGYVVPGGIQAAVVPTAEGEPVDWPAATAVKPTTGAFSLTVERAQSTAPQTLWVRSCWGSADTPTCTVTSQAL